MLAAGGALVILLGLYLPPALDALLRLAAGGGP
jgi:hypothetical protein